MAEKTTLKAPAASKYTITELSHARGKFAYTGALVAAALEETGRQSFTLEEAKKIVEAFAKRPV